jgi:hypothetical protein
VRRERQAVAAPQELPQEEQNVAPQSWPEAPVAQRDSEDLQEERSAAQSSADAAVPQRAEDEAAMGVKRQAQASRALAALQRTLQWPVPQLRPVQQKNYDP